MSAEVVSSATTVDLGVLLVVLGLVLTVVTAVLGVVWKSSLKLDRVAQQVLPNGGSSMRDDVTAIKAQLDGVKADIGDVAGMAGTAHRRIDAHLAQHNK